MAKGGGKEEEEEESSANGMHGDLLYAIISHVPLIDLLPAYYVSKDWRIAVRQSLVNPQRAKPWLIAHVQDSRNPSLLVTRGYDPESHVWIEIPRGKAPKASLPVRSSHSNVVYTLTPSKISFSLDALNAKWHDVIGPKVWRSDPIVAVVGSQVVVAGGVCDFEDDQLAVEVYNSRSREWDTCPSMPDILKGSAASTWLSVAVSDKKMFLLEKNSGTLCTFDPDTKTWEGGLDHLRPNRSIFFSLIGVLNNQLILVGLLGDPENVESLMIWEVNYETFCCNQVGKMPARMLQQLIYSCSSPSSVNISMSSDTIYIYNSSDPKEIFSCELSNNGSCHWGSLHSCVVNDENVMHRFAFTCSKVGIDDLQTAFGLGNGPRS